MRPSKVTLPCIRKRQLEELFVNTKKDLAIGLGVLNSADVNILTIEQLADVMLTYQISRKGFKLKNEEYLNIVGEYDSECNELIEDYNDAISNVKHLINVKYAFGHE